MGCHGNPEDLQKIFPTQGLNLFLLCLLCCRQILYPLSYLGTRSDENPPNALIYSNTDQMLVMSLSICKALDRENRTQPLKECLSEESD